MKMPDFKMGLGETVYLRYASERFAGMVTGLVLRGSNKIYEVAWEDRDIREHAEMELTSEFKPNFKDNPDE